MRMVLVRQNIDYLAHWFGIQSRDKARGLVGLAQTQRRRRIDLDDKTPDSEQYGAHFERHRALLKF